MSEQTPDTDNIFTKPKERKVSEKDADTKALEADLSANLKMKVDLNHKPGQESGQLVLHYETMDQLDELCRMLTGS